MTFTPGEKVVVQKRLMYVATDETVAGVEFVGLVDPRAIQYVAASDINQPPPPPPTATVNEPHPPTATKGK